jgi:hypothetical protein
MEDTGIELERCAQRVSANASCSQRGGKQRQRRKAQAQRAAAIQR